MSRRHPGRSYDRVMLDSVQQKYYGHSDFYNFGYWTPETQNQKEASENLVEKLLSFIPEKSGNILDVACGLGASTRYVLKYYQPADVTAINLSEVQLARARQNAPGCTFLFMDAACLDFPENSFDNVICIEAAFHFETRDQFYREAFRVLKPGGRLVTSDILIARFAAGKITANAVPTPERLGQRLSRAGFEEVQAIDATAACWRGFQRNVLRAARSEHDRGQLTTRQRLRMLGEAFNIGVLANLVMRRYVLTSARKPQRA